MSVLLVIMTLLTLLPDFRTCRFQYRNRYQAYQQYQLLDNETAP